MVRFSGCWMLGFSFLDIGGFSFWTLDLSDRCNINQL
jgi:hypothetical protein